MSKARQELEAELERVRALCRKHRIAAFAANDRNTILRRLLAVERLTVELEALEAALASFDDATLPITIDRDATTEILAG